MFKMVSGQILVGDNLSTDGTNKDGKVYFHALYAILAVHVQESVLFDLHTVELFQKMYVYHLAIFRAKLRIKLIRLSNC